MRRFNIKEILKDKLSEEELKLVPSSFDIIGSKEKAAVIVEIPEGLKSREKLIAEVIMQMQKSVKSVLEKTSERKGELRLRGYKLIAGDDNTEAVHKEYGYLLRLDPQKVYFSPREATERQRIAEQVKPNETVMLMFAGIGCFAIAIAKKQPEVNKIIAVEINPHAVEYMKTNARINKISDKIVPILGDVREVCPKYFGKCDRVVMPLPLGAENFLDIAISCLKEEGVIHFYNWGREDDLYSNALKLIESATKKLKVGFEVLNKRKVLPYAPGKYKVCIDFGVKRG